ncbi:unnamed protein product [Schistosoma mattheei]|uniref:Uncharacterized protein n=1 Tax=Schistosoma mattheei TaxID=31246 RepID=A0A183PDK6_9TREM|nr:unnamed protein product [Schistosoma mattheei]
MGTQSKRPKENDETDGKISKAACGMSGVDDNKRDDDSVNSMYSDQISTCRIKLGKTLIRKNLEKILELEVQLKKRLIWLN